MQLECNPGIVGVTSDLRLMMNGQQGTIRRRDRSVLREDT